MEYMKMLDLLNYKRILQAKLVNPEYADEFSVNKIASKVKLITLGCKSKDKCCGPEIVFVPTTTTTTTAITCFRPVGVNSGYIVYNAVVNDNVIWTFGDALPEAACPAFTSFHDAIGSGFNVSSMQIQYGTIAVGEQVFMNWEDLSCQTLFNGVFWINPTTQYSFDYFRDVTDIQIITVTGGVITSILNCSV
jgi:hypothetical protein